MDPRARGPIPVAWEERLLSADSDSRVHLPSDLIQVTTAAPIPITMMGEKLD